MPLFFFIIGFVLVDSGFRGNAQALYQQFAADAKGFVAFGAVIIILGAAGTFSSVRPVAKGLLLLIFVVFAVRNGNQIVQGIQTAVNENVPSGSSNANGSQTQSYNNSNDSNFGAIENEINSTAAQQSQNSGGLLSGIESGLELAGGIAALV